ncbi:hypothetical protein [Enterococcus termitis]|uniref:Uncharacterized protein n=1 Tax=Enterococcus termitis TaxID=332950 RepID=A0A1E5H5R0_9ENTE|nr:hypothetical protein [Enterococcus termitis]OEG20264.1 hypothetical protein BCR25_00080 [Enterococcus termitis]OJG97322.1 hypothetical protein RV18_GL001010 [Enterococcus termitis]
MADIVQLEEKGNLLYPKTHTSAVEGLKAEFENLSKNVQPKVDDKELWSGAWYGGQGQVTTPSKPLSSCTNGWILQWEGYSEQGAPNSSAFQFIYIPKQFGIYHQGRGVVCMINSYNGGNPQVKYLYVYNDKLSGHANNALDKDTTGKGTKMYVLTKIYEY